MVSLGLCVNNQDCVDHQNCVKIFRIFYGQSRISMDSKNQGGILWSNAAVLLPEIFRNRTEILVKDDTFCYRVSQKKNGRCFASIFSTS